MVLFSVFLDSYITPTNQPSKCVSKIRSIDKNNKDSINFGAALLKWLNLLFKAQNM